jgi:predicted alpha/beta superfamily hydrolase
MADRKVKNIKVIDKSAKKIIRKKYKGKKGITGNVVYHKNFHSVLLGNERDILVWLPPSYSIQQTKKYPVLYMQDGQNLVDPFTSFAGIDWQVDETATKLIKTGKMKEIIIVGINNTKNRLEEYSNSEQGNNYIRFVIGELKTFIDSKYRTLTDSKNTAVMGSSMGGLISFLIAWKNPDVFSMAGCMSSSFYYDNDKIFETVKNDLKPKKGLKIYIDHGEDGLVRGQKMFSLLTHLGYIIGTDIDYFYAPGAEHNEAEWARRLERPLLFFFGSKQ